MTLEDLRNVISFTFDIADDIVDASFYIELDEIPPEQASQIEVVRIDTDLVVCKLTNYLQRLANFHPSRITDYLEDNYYEGELRDRLIKQLTRRRSAADNYTASIIDDGGEAVYHFINQDMYDFLTR